MRILSFAQLWIVRCVGCMSWDSLSQNDISPSISLKIWIIFWYLIRIYGALFLVVEWDLIMELKSRRVLIWKLTLTLGISLLAWAQAPGRPSTNKLNCNACYVSFVFCFTSVPNIHHRINSAISGIFDWGQSWSSNHHIPKIYMIDLCLWGLTNPWVSFTNMVNST